MTNSNYNLFLELHKELSERVSIITKVVSKVRNLPSFTLEWFDATKETIVLHGIIENEHGYWIEKQIIVPTYYVFITQKEIEANETKKL